MAGGAAHEGDLQTDQVRRDLVDPRVVAAQPVPAKAVQVCGEDEQEEECEGEEHDENFGLDERPASDASVPWVLRALAQLQGHYVSASGDHRHAI